MVYVLRMTYTSDIETKLLIIIINFGLTFNMNLVVTFNFNFVSMYSIHASNELFKHESIS